MHRLNRRTAEMVSQVLGDAVARGEFHVDVGVELLRDMIFDAIGYQAWACLRGNGDFSADWTTAGITTVVYRAMARTPATFLSRDEAEHAQ